MCNCKIEEIVFSKVKPNAILPTKREEDGCLDIYACFEEDDIYIAPGEMKLIPSGIASACSSKYRFGIRERGSTGTRCMAVRAGQIDSGYRGEWSIPINNTGIKTIILSNEITETDEDNDYIYYPTSKAIAQFALEEVPVVTIREVDYETLKAIPSERGTGKLGSSLK